LFNAIHSKASPRERLQATFALTEGVVRFLALVGLADASSYPRLQKRLPKWLHLLETPGAGKLLALLRDTTEGLVGEGGPFVDGLANLHNNRAWHEAVGDVVAKRNETTHRFQSMIPDRSAQQVLDSLVDPMARLLHGIAFLQDYQLGIAQEARRRDTNTFSINWIASRGQSETGDLARLRGLHGPYCDVFLLLHTASGRGLYLFPWLLWRASPLDDIHHIFWLEKIVPNDDMPMRYLHPLWPTHQLSLKVLEVGFPEETGVPLDEFLGGLDRWPKRVDIGLDAPSLQRLGGPAHQPGIDARYHINGRLGEGGMGTVWDAYDTKLGRRCAIKTLRTNSATPDQVSRLRQEGKALARLRHPGVVQVYDHFTTDDGAPSLVMEFIEGENLQQVLQARRKLPLFEAVKVIEEALTILQAIHKCNIVHRDLKPSNLILSPDGIRIVDFGIARLADGTRLTKTFDRMGTPAFMAPEQWLLGQATPRSDIFAAGRLLFTLLVGRTPITEEESLADIAPDLPPEIVQLFVKATSRRPEDRFASATEMLEALRQAMPGNPAEVGTPAPEKEQIPPIQVAPIVDAAVSIDDQVAEENEPPAPDDAECPRVTPNDWVAPSMAPSAGNASGIPSAEQFVSVRTPSSEFDSWEANLHGAVREGPAQMDELLGRLFPLLGPDDPVVHSLLQALDGIYRQNRSSRIGMVAASYAGRIAWKVLDDRVQAEFFYRALPPEGAHADECTEFYRGFYASRGNWLRLEQFLHEVGQRRGWPQVRVRRLLAQAAHEYNNPSKELSYWQAVAQSNPDDKEAEVELERLYTQFERWPSLADLLKERLKRFEDAAPDVKVSILRQMLRIYAEKMKAEPKVLATYQQILEVDPANLDAINALLARYEKAGRWPDYAKVLARKIDAVEDNKERIALLEEQANLMETRFANLLEALKTYERILELAPGREDIVNRLKDLYEKRQDHEGLIRLRRAAAEQIPNPETRVIKLAALAQMAWERLRKAAIAIELWERVLQLDPAHVGALLALDELYEREKDFGRQCGVVSRLADLSTQVGERIVLLENVARIQGAKLNDSASATETWRRILEMQPSHDRAKRELRARYLAEHRWNDLEWFLRKFGSVEELARTLESQLGTVEDSHEKLELMIKIAAIWCHEANQPQKAIRQLEKVLSLQPNNLQAATELVALYRQTGDWQKLPPVYGVLIRQARNPDERARWVTEAVAALEQGQPSP